MMENPSACPSGIRVFGLIRCSGFVDRAYGVAKKKTPFATDKNQMDTD
jgi:hypothetical protein